MASITLEEKKPSVTFFLPLLFDTYVTMEMKNKTLISPHLKHDRKP